MAGPPALPIYESLLIEALKALGIDSGTVSVPPPAGAAVLQDDSKSWPVDVHRGRLVKIIRGAGAGQLRVILGNSDRLLTLNQPWTVPPNQASVYVIVGMDIAQTLRDVFGGGSDISAANPLEVHDPKVGSLISYEGTTTADGAPDGSTLICTDLTTKPDYDGHWVVITSGAYSGQARDITGATTGGTVAVSEAFDGQVVSGTKFVILAMKALPAEVAAIEAKLDHAEHGLAALKALVDAVESKLDDGTTGLAALRVLLDAITAYVDDLETRLSATRAGYLDELGPANIPADIDELKTSKGRQLFSMDFWSTPQEEVQLTNVAGDKSLPDVAVADLPAGAVVVRAIAMFKFRMIENTNAAANKLNGAQEIQVRLSPAGAWTDAINFVDDQFGIAGTTREGGDVCIGAIDVAAVVNANATYNFQWDDAVADLANLQFNDIQVGLRIWYSV
jgi:hypothetical protein